MLYDCLCGWLNVTCNINVQMFLSVFVCWTWLSWSPHHALWKSQKALVWSELIVYGCCPLKVSNNITWGCDMVGRTRRSEGNGDIFLFFLYACAHGLMWLLQFFKFIIVWCHYCWIVNLAVKFQNEELANGFSLAVLLSFKGLKPNCLLFFSSTWVFLWKIWN